VNAGAAASGARLLRAGTALAADAVAADVVEALRRDGVRSIVLRGPAIRRWLYPEGEPRAYRDVDLLVEPDKREAAEAVLRRLGFVHRQAGFAPGEAVEHAGEWICRRPAVVVDLHRGLEGVGADPAELWSGLAAGGRQLEVAGVAVAVPAEAALALIVTLHAAHHGLESSKQLTELRRAIERARFETWEEAGVLAARLKSVTGFAAGLRLVPEGAGIAERLGLPHGGDPETRLRAASAHPTAIGFARLVAARGIRAKVALVRRKLVPTPAFMRHWSPLARRGPLGMALAYLWRPLWLLLRLPPSTIAWLRAHR
jgi:Uncharacterised nucleotidyltransferase